MDKNAQEAAEMKESRIRMAVNDLFKKKEAARTVALDTPWSSQPDIPWNEYPRPQLRRDIINFYSQSLISVAVH